MMPISRIAFIIEASESGDIGLSQAGLALRGEPPRAAAGHYIYFYFVAMMLFH